MSLCDDNGKVHYNLNANEHEYVDLGLPSGTLWATMNVGASKPSDYGQYFQWGDTQGYSADQVGTGDGKKEFSSHWSDYKWYESGDYYEDNIVLNKYTTPGATLDLEDDAAHVNMGGDWHMPTPTQFRELINTANTTSTWTTQDGVNGRLFTSKSDSSKSIFIPAAGKAYNGSVHWNGSDCYTWSSMIYKTGVFWGWLLSVNSGRGSLGYGVRNEGQTIRGVIG